LGSTEEIEKCLLYKVSYVAELHLSKRVSYPDPMNFITSTCKVHKTTLTHLFFNTP